MTCKIKTLTRTQSDDVAKLWFDGWHDGHANIVPTALGEMRTLDSFQARTLEHLDQTLVAIDEGQVLGFVMVKADEIYQMYVGAAARGKGVAQLLMQHGEARIKAQGHHTAWLSCAIGNERAARFYVKSGWINKRTETVALDTLDDPFELELWRFEKALA